jgi:hypothetical protein
MIYQLAGNGNSARSSKRIDRWNPANQRGVLWDGFRCAGETTLRTKRPREFGAEESAPRNLPTSCALFEVRDGMIAGSVPR